MSLQQQPNSGIPEETKRIARAAFPKGNAYMTLRDQLETIYTDNMFVEVFSKTGQPGEAPWRLVLVTIMQFAEGLSDRQAADAVRSRIDWKYLLGLSLEDAGFHYSVLSEFRTRLIEGQLEQSLLEELLEQFRQRNLLKERSQQRTDATHILSVVRNLNRLELAGETLRSTLDQLAQDSPDWLKKRVPSIWYKRYATRFEQAHLPKSEAKREELAAEIGQDGYQLLEWANAPDSPESVQKHPAMETLRKIWVQQYYIQDEEVIWRQKDQVPSSGQGIASPFDTQARFSIKRETEWLGYKGHFTEICEVDWPHWITHVETTPATVPDAGVVEHIHHDLAEQGLLPSQHFMDMGYIDTTVLADSQKQYSVEVIGPIQMDNTWQATSPDGLDVTCFDIDWANHQVTCPAGKVAKNWSEAPDVTGLPRISVMFSKKDCQPCLLRSRCTRSVDGPRRLSFKPQDKYELLLWARQRQQTPEFREIYKRRSGIEGTFSHAVRCCDLRRSRYVGLVKTHLQHVLTAIALNLIRFVNWFNAIPLTSTRKSCFARLAPLGL